MGAFESQLQKDVISYLRKKGFYVLNVPGNAFLQGVPDILACILGRWVAFELKSSDGTIRPLQKVHMRSIRKSGGIAEPVRSLERVKEIIHAIETGQEWPPTVF